MLTELLTRRAPAHFHSKRDTTSRNRASSLAHRVLSLSPIPPQQVTETPLTASGTRRQVSRSARHLSVALVLAYAGAVVVGRSRRWRGRVRRGGRSARTRCGGAGRHCELAMRPEHPAAMMAWAKTLGERMRDALSASHGPSTAVRCAAREFTLALHRGGRSRQLSVPTRRALGLSTFVFDRGFEGVVSSSARRRAVAGMESGRYTVHTEEQRACTATGARRYANGTQRPCRHASLWLPARALDDTTVRTGRSKKVNHATLLVAARALCGLAICVPFASILSPACTTVVDGTAAACSGTTIGDPMLQQCAPIVDAGSPDSRVDAGIAGCSTNAECTAAEPLEACCTWLAAPTDELADGVGLHRYSTDNPSAVPDLSCLANPAARGTPAKVRLTGYVRLYGRGNDSAGVKVTAFAESHPKAPDGTFNEAPDGSVDTAPLGVYETTTQDAAPALRGARFASTRSRASRPKRRSYSRPAMRAVARG